MTTCDVCKKEEATLFRGDGRFAKWICYRCLANQKNGFVATDIKPIKDVDNKNNNNHKENGELKA
jgi:hypothetical protein